MPQSCISPLFRVAKKRGDKRSKAGGRLQRIKRFKKDISPLFRAAKERGDKRSEVGVSRRSATGNRHCVRDRSGLMPAGV